MATFCWITPVAATFSQSRRLLFHNQSVVVINMVQTLKCSQISCQRENKDIRTTRYNSSVDRYKNRKDYVIEKVNEGFVIRLSNLPMTMFEDHIVKFLGNDCAIAGGKNGVTLLFGLSGRQTDRAYVELVDEESVQKALAKTSEYGITVTRSTNERLYAIKQDARKPGREEGVVYLSCLPKNCSKEEIAKRYSNLGMVPDGIMLPVNKSGENDGKAFVRFTSEKMLRKALNQRFGFYSRIGDKYVKVYRRNMSVAIRAMKEAKSDLDPSAYAECFVLMTGLPKDHVEDDIIEFFSSQGVIPTRIEKSQRDRISCKLYFKTRKEAVLAMRMQKRRMEEGFIRLWIEPTNHPFILEPT